MIVGSKDIHNQLTNKTYTSLCFIYTLYSDINLNHSNVRASSGPAGLGYPTSLLFMNGSVRVSKSKRKIRVGYILCMEFFL